MSYLCAKFEENPCMGTEKSTPLFKMITLLFQRIWRPLLYLENINLILAFIINIISQPIEHLNITSALIVRLIRKCTWYFLTQ